MSKRNRSTYNRDDRHHDEDDTTNLLNRRTWDESFQALKDYKKVNGHCQVPSNYDEDTALGHWVRKQRRNENNGSLEPDRRVKLDKIGFIWKMRKESNPLPPPSKRAKTSSRRSVKKELKKRESPAAAMNLKKGNRTWDESYQLLKQYFRKNGNSNVPRSYGKDPALGYWVYKNRLHQHDLTKRQRSRLESLNFDFQLKKDKQQRLWEKKYEQLKQYQHENGDCDVDDRDALGKWVQEQRRLFSEGRLSKYRRERLQELGLDLSSDAVAESDQEDELVIADSRQHPRSRRDRESLAEKWSINYKRLKSFYKMNGHCHVSRNEDKTLNYWIQRQRHLNLIRKLKPERHALLDDLNFEWYMGATDLPDDYQDEMIGRLRNFKQEYGHVQVPRKYRRGGLGEWVGGLKLQGREGFLDPVLADELLRLGFTWNEDRPRWLKNFGEVEDELKWRRENTGTNKPISLSPEVESWLKVQYMLIDYDVLSPKRRAALKTLGVAWDGERLSWAERADDKTERAKPLAGLDLKNAALSWTPDKSPVGKFKHKKNLEASSSPTDASVPNSSTPDANKLGAGKAEPSGKDSDTTTKDKEESKVGSEIVTLNNMNEEQTTSDPKMKSNDSEGGPAATIQPEISG